MMRFLLRRLRGGRDDGIALPVALGLGLVMLVLVAGGMAVATNGVRKTDTDENWQAALSAAYAGVSDYQSRLNNDSTYYKYGNPSAAFSASSASQLTLPANWQTANPALGISASDPWAQIPVDPSAAATATKSYFRYEVDLSSFASQGVIRLRSTGRVGSVTRSVVATLKQSAFLDYLYSTDFETSDPDVTPSTQGSTVCNVYLWQSPTRPSSCPTIQFGPFDTLNGPVHSNDTLTICGSTFKGSVSTANPNKPTYITPSGCSAPSFKVSTDPSVTPTIPLPATNSGLINNTMTDQPSVPQPGCLYTGPTVISFDGTGNMRVWSPYTRMTQITSSRTSGSTPAMCGSISALHSTAGALVPVLNSNMVFVQSVPTTSTDVNYWAPGTTPSGLSCQSVSQGSGTSSGGWKFGSFQFPVQNEVLPSSSTSGYPAYSCTNGDLYVSGTVVGQTTLAADHYIYVTGDLTYGSTSRDILGLIGQNAVWVWNPIVSSSSWFSTSYSYYLNDTNRTIDAAILSVSHTFQVQNYDGGAPNLGTRGTLTVLGAIAQKYRGTVATTNNNTLVSGYAKNYQYDTRFASTSPPDFLTPTSTTYRILQYAGVKAVYNADGSPAS